MEKFIEKFNIFDIFTMLGPGLIISCLYGVSLSFQYYDIWKNYGNGKYVLFFVFSYFLGIIVGYIVSLIIFQIIIKMSDLILAISSNTISLVIILFLTKLLIYGLGFFIAIKVSWINIITVFLGYFIIKITIYIDTYRQDRLDKIKNN